MNGANRKRRLQFHAVKSHGFHYVWLDDETGMYLAGFNDLETAKKHGERNGWVEADKDVQKPDNHDMV